MAALSVDGADFVNGVLGAFGAPDQPAIHASAPNREHTWPFTVSKDIREGCFYYEMLASVAEVIRNIEKRKNNGWSPAVAEETTIWAPQAAAQMRAPRVKMTRSGTPFVTKD